jgi:acetate kinase
MRLSAFASQSRITVAPEIADARLIIAHLGNGASLSAG